MAHYGDDMTTRAKALAGPAATQPGRPAGSQRWLRRERVLLALAVLLAGVDVFLAAYFEPGDGLSRPQVDGAPPLVEAPLVVEAGDSPGPLPAPVTLELGGQAARARLHYTAMKKLDFVVVVDLFHNPTRSITSFDKI